MTKQYISILDLLPTIIQDKNAGINGRIFSFVGRQHHYYAVNEASTPDKKQLTFQRLDEKIDSLSVEIARRTGNTHHTHSSYNSRARDNPPYIVGESYEVPHILEMEYLKQSVYQDIMNDELTKYIENIFYQYLLYYDRIVYENQAGDRSDIYHTFDEDSTLYQSIEPFIRDMNSEDEDFHSKVEEIILTNYKELDKIKRQTKKDLRHSVNKMYANKNLSELLEVANTRQSIYSTDPSRVSQSEDMSLPMPLLMLYSDLARKTQEISFPSYRKYLEIFEGYSYSMRQELLESYTYQEFLEEKRRLHGDRYNEEGREYIYTYGNIARASSMYVSSHDERMNNFLFPHIMNQVRLAGFESPDKMVVPQELMDSFINEPWSHLVTPETIVYNSHLDWSESEE